MSWRWVLAALFVLACVTEVRGAPPDPLDDPVLVAAGFLDAHPDLRYRMLGMDSYRDGKHDDAMRYFRRAAFYADKPSQAMVAEMLWRGDGGERNPSLAYAWMDLAAERGYLIFLQTREKYWEALDEQQRKVALEEGQAVYGRYGDEVAEARIAAVLRRARTRVTGSRTGSAGNLQIIVPGPGGTDRTISAHQFYRPEYWDPAKYRQWHDDLWRNARIGRITVHDIEQMSPEPRISAPGQRDMSAEQEMDDED
jgi:hypothetical protein